MFSFGVIDQEKHIGRKTKPVSELLYEDTDIDRDQTFRQCDTQVDKSQVRQCNSQRHRPKPFLQTSL